MIHISGLNKTYSSGTQAVNQLSLEITSGEILALLGPNGAGKSSVIRILTTLAGFDDGKVTVAGFDIDREPGKVRASIGYVAQETGVDFFLTGRENLSLQGHLYRLDKKEIKARIQELSEYYELTEVLDTLVSNYSGGMRRKLDIATALIHRPKVLFLDEPTLGLDTSSRQSLWKYIRKLNAEQGLTILLTTHYLDEADALADRVAIIHKGVIKVVEKPDTLKDQIRGDVVSLQLKNPLDKNLIADKLASNKFVKDLKWEADKIHLYVSNGATSIPRLIEHCTELKTTVENVSYSRPTLDDVFIQYTGKSIEAGDSETENKWWEKWAGKGGGGKWAKQWQDNNSDATDTASIEDADDQSSSTESSSNAEQKWSEEEVKQWHKDKQWSQEETEQWQNNKQWSEKEAANWHNTKTDETQNNKQNKNDTESSSSEKQWPSDSEWSKENNQQWGSKDKWPDGSDK